MAALRRERGLLEVDLFGAVGDGLKGLGELLGDPPGSSACSTPIFPG